MNYNYRGTKLNCFTKKECKTNLELYCHIQDWIRTYEETEGSHKISDDKIKSCAMDINDGYSTRYILRESSSNKTILYT